MKTCFKCDRTLPRSAFYRHSQMRDGLLGKCKDCTRRDVSANRHRRYAHYLEYERRRSENGKRLSSIRSRASSWRKANPVAVRAHRAVAKALRTGQLVRGACAVCGGRPTHAHHNDYARPLEVTWLCVPCHRSVHAKEHGQTPWRLVRLGAVG